MSTINEDTVEEAAIEWFQSLGYAYLPGPEIIGAWKVAVPDEPKILDAFHRACAPFFEQAKANRTQSRTLATLRDTLLPKLLSGELSMTEVEQSPPEAVR